MLNEKRIKLSWFFLGDEYFCEQEKSETRCTTRRITSWPSRWFAVTLRSSGTKFAAKVTVLSKALKFVEPPKLKPRLKPKPPPPPPVSVPIGLCCVPCFDGYGALPPVMTLIMIVTAVGAGLVTWRKHLCLHNYVIDHITLLIPSVIESITCAGHACKLCQRRVLPSSPSTSSIDRVFNNPRNNSLCFLWVQINYNVSYVE